MIATLTETVQVFLPQPTTTLMPVQPQPPSISDATLTPQATQPVSVPDANQYTWRLVASGLTKPVGITHAGDGSGRLFIIEKEGLIRIARDLPFTLQPFLDIRERVGSRSSEQGLLGLAFHPKYNDNGYFFVNYTDQSGNTVIARYQVSNNNPDQADPSSESQLLYIQQPYANHNGGDITFGPDGYLYLALGDGGSGGDPQGNGQSLNTLLGKILRIDVNHQTDTAQYAIPADNPYPQSQFPEIWAYGLRNPWRFSFDRLTGDLYIGDVGQDQWEEINFLPAGSPGGANFGWNYQEGRHSYKGSPPVNVILLPPILEYDHNEGCSVTGGYVYRGLSMPEWQGIYLFGDFCSGRVWAAWRSPTGEWQKTLIFTELGSIASFGEDEWGEIYLVDYDGNVYQLVKKTNQPATTPTPKVDPAIVFAVIGDYGSGDANAMRVANLVNSWQPDFIITVGDNNYPVGSAETIDQNIGQFYSPYIHPYQGRYGPGGEKNRFFPVLGNHDLDTLKGQPYFDYFELPGNERYYDFVQGPVHFFALNSDTREPDGVNWKSIQAQWLQAALEGSTSLWNVVYMHAPPYSSGHEGPIDWMQWPFQEWGADMVLAGHDHDYERLQVDGFPYIINGLGGGAIYDFGTILLASQARYNRGYGAILVNASNEQMTFQFITVNNQIIDTFTLFANP